MIIALNIFFPIRSIFAVGYIDQPSNICMEINKQTYKEIKESIQGLIAGEIVDTGRLEYFLNPKPSCIPDVYCLTSNTEFDICCDDIVLCNSCMKTIHNFLRNAYSAAKYNHNLVARFYLLRADTHLMFIWRCFDCECNHLIPSYPWEADALPSQYFCISKSIAE
jgi:hypothetical protein